MKMTLLQMVQSILSSMGSDEVNSISDTTESLQVADIVKQTYMNMLGRYDLPQHNQLFQLQASDSVTSPVLMTFPQGVTRIEWLKYLDTNPADNAETQVDQYGAYSPHDTNTDLVSNANGWSTTSLSSNTVATGTLTFTVGSGLNINVNDTAYITVVGNYNILMTGNVLSYSGTTLVINVTNAVGSGTYANWVISQSGSFTGPIYKEVHIIPVEDFVVMTNSIGPDFSGNVGQFNFATTENATGLPMSFSFYYYTDRQPQYCCVIGNQYLIFDSYDNSQDSTLQSSKTMAWGWVYPPLVMQDNVYPPIEDQTFPLFFNDAKALAFAELKQTPNQRAEEEVGRQVVSLQKWKAIANKPGYFNELPNFGRRWSGRYGGNYW
jgi:hypothetical protein